MPQTLRLLHVTDLHLRDAVPGTAEIALRRSREIPRLLDALEARLPALSPDVVAITGDLLHAPYGLFRGEDRYGMSALRAAVVEDYRALKARFERWGVPFMVLPGNHDDPAAFRQVFGGSGTLDVNGHRLVSFSDMEGEGNVPWRTGAEWDRFVASTRPEAGEGLFHIHLQHFVVHPAVDHPYPHNYGNAAAILSAVGAADHVVMSIAGHYHPGGGPVARDGTVHLVGRAFCEPPHPASLLVLSDGELVAHETVSFGPLPAPDAVVVVDRDTLLAPAAHFRSADGIVLDAARVEALACRTDAVLVCTASLDRDDLPVCDWARLSDAHDAFHARLAGRGVVLDALYYTTRRTREEASAAGLPRIAIGPEEDLMARIREDLCIDVARAANALR